MDEDSRSSQINQRVERDVRLLIGDQQMQIIALRAMVEVIGQQKEQPAPSPEKPVPPPAPSEPEHEKPPHPVFPDSDEPNVAPDKVAPRVARARSMNGGSANGRHR